MFFLKGQFHRLKSLKIPGTVKTLFLSLGKVSFSPWFSLDISIQPVSSFSWPLFLVSDSWSLVLGFWLLVSASWRIFASLRLGSWLLVLGSWL
jgi:hypothetical protein